MSIWLPFVAVSLARGHLFRRLFEAVQSRLVPCARPRPRIGHRNNSSAGQEGLSYETTTLQRCIVMKNKKDNDFADRRSAAADAKAARLDAHRVAKKSAEPTRLARQEERLAVAAARDERQAERARIKLEEQERAALEKVAADAAAEAEEAARAEAEKKRSSCDAEDEAARKAERDRRYANRKARQR